MNDVTVIKFEDAPWARRSMRGKGFGVRGNSYFNIKGRGPWLLVCPTGSKPEQLIRLRADAHSSFGMDVIEPVFSLDPEGRGEPMDFANLFMSDDGLDQWPPRDHLTGVPTPRGIDCSLIRSADYYFYIPEIVGGHPSQKPGVRIGYVSTLTDAIDDFESGEPMPHPITGEPGMWYPDD